MSSREIEEFNNTLGAEWGLAGVVDREALYPSEVFWRDHQPWLEEHGYLLRPRFQPNWIPSWKGTRKDWSRCEDGQSFQRKYMLDATRRSDGSYVMLKRITRSDHPHEIPIAQSFSTPERASEPKNHCVPVYEVLDVPDNIDEQILVMPFLRRYNDPPFERVADAVDFFRQVIEGLHYLHANNVAHRDCTGTNIMMDPTGLFPGSFHPVKTDRSRDFRKTATRLTREQKPPTYYLTDFGLSRQYEPQDRPPLEGIIVGGDKTAPEHKNRSGRCDPFPTDVYYLGNVFRTDFLATKRGLEFMQPLVRDMVQDDPAKRPTMDDVLSRFEKLVSSLSPWTLGSRIASKDEFILTTVARGLPHVGRQVGSALRQQLPFMRRNSGKPPV